jgi:hypothetical protein
MLPIPYAFLVVLIHFSQLLPVDEPQLLILEDGRKKKGRRRIMPEPQN